MILQELAHRFPPIPELIEKGGRKSLCKSEECGASKHQDQIITVSAAAENGLGCERECVSSNRQPIFHAHRLGERASHVRGKSLDSRSQGLDSVFPGSVSNLSKNGQGSLFIARGPNPLFSQ